MCYSSHFFINNFLYAIYDSYFVDGLYSCKIIHFLCILPSLPSFPKESFSWKVVNFLHLTCVMHLFLLLLLPFIFFRFSYRITSLSLLVNCDAGHRSYSQWYCFCSYIFLITSSSTIRIFEINFAQTFRELLLWLTIIVFRCAQDALTISSNFMALLK